MHKEDTLLQKATWNDTFNQSKQQRIILHDSTDVRLLKPSDPHYSVPFSQGIMQVVLLKVVSVYSSVDGLSLMSYVVELWMTQHM